MLTLGFGKVRNRLDRTESIVLNDLFCMFKFLWFV